MNKKPNNEKQPENNFDQIDPSKLAVNDVISSKDAPAPTHKSNKNPIENQLNIEELSIKKDPVTSYSVPSAPEAPSPPSENNILKIDELSTKDKINNTTNNQNTENILKPTIEELQAFKKFYMDIFNNKTISLIVDKKIDENNESYYVRITKDTVTFDIKQEMNKTIYKYTFNTGHLIVNNLNSPEKLPEFYNLMEQISADVRDNKAELLTEER